MSLIQFQCVADAPFLMYDNVAKNVFRALEEPWSPTGGWAPEDMPALIEKARAFIAMDKERARVMRDEIEESLYEDGGREEVDKVVFLYQRMVPVLCMLERAYAKGEVIAWGPLH